MTKKTNLPASHAVTVIVVTLLLAAVNLALFIWSIFLVVGGVAALIEHSYDVWSLVGLAFGGSYLMGSLVGNFRR